MTFRATMRKNGANQMLSPLNEQTRSVRFTAMSRPLPLIALLLMPLAGCSKTVSVMPMPLPPANLAAHCQALESPPNPLTDPERAVWEVRVVGMYADCAMKHRLLSEAWTKAVQSSKK